VSDPGVEAYSTAFNKQRLSPTTYFSLVVIQIVVFIAALLSESSSEAGRIEDIAVNKSMQGRKLG
jgi:glucosamine-phosphate N-acetyltransferase